MRLGPPPGAGQGIDPMLQMHWLWQKEMLKAMKRMNKQHSGSGDGSSDDEDTGPKDPFAGLQRLRRRVERKPDKVTLAYVDRMRRDLGIVHNSQWWQATDYTKRIQVQFGNQRGMLRVHFAVSECLQEMLNGRQSHAMAHMSLICQAVHQCALDRGDWTSAQYILPGTDYLSRPDFGAGERELVEIAKYRKALKELKKTHGGAEREQDHEGEKDEAQRNRRAKAKAKT